MKHICKIIYRQDPVAFKGNKLCNCKEPVWCRVQFDNLKNHYPQNYKEFKKALYELTLKKLNIK